MRIIFNCDKVAQIPYYREKEEETVWPNESDSAFWISVNKTETKTGTAADSEPLGRVVKETGW